MANLRVITLTGAEAALGESVIEDFASNCAASCSAPVLQAMKKPVLFGMT